MELACRQWGASSTSPSDLLKEKLVFLHGMGGTGALWRPIAASLEDRYAILAPDQRGHGKSQIIATSLGISGGREMAQYGPLDYGRDVFDTMKSRSFHPSWLIGHSMGVRSACAAAHLAPDWTRGLVLVDLGFSGQAGGGLGEGLARFLRVLPESFSSREEARAFMKEHCPDPAIGQYLLAVSTPAQPLQTPLGIGKITFPFDHSALIQTIEAAAHSSVRAWVSELLERGLPILVLRGENSLVWSRAEFEAEKERFASFPSIAFREIEGAGHGLPFEKRMEFVQILKDFVDSRPLPRPAP